MNLVRAEISRLAARRFVQLMVVLLIGAFAITVATTVASSHQPTAAEVSQAEQMAEREQRRAERWRADCLAAQHPDAPRSLNDQYPPDCEIRGWAVHKEDFLSGVFVFEREIRGLTYFLAAFLALFGFLVGASYIGADLNSGGMTNLLLWRPKRMTVLGVKLGTLLGSMLVLSVAATALYVGAFYWVAKLTGFPGDLDAEFWRWLGLTSARSTGLALGASALGFAIATLGRHTAAALGVIAGYVVVWEVGARIVMEVVEAARPEQWMLSTYLGAWMVGRIGLWDRQACRFGDCDGSYTLTWVHASVVLAVVVGGLVVGAFANFRRRDLA